MNNLQQLAKTIDCDAFLKMQLELCPSRKEFPSIPGSEYHTYSQVVSDFTTKIINYWVEANK